MKIKVVMFLILWLVNYASAVTTVDMVVTNTKVYGVVDTTEGFDQVATQLDAEGNGFAVVDSLTAAELAEIKQNYYRYDYIKTRSGLIAINSGAMCAESGDYYLCSGSLIAKTSQRKILVYKNLPPETQTVAELPFCSGRCYDARADAASFQWTSAMGQKNHTFNYKKGITMSGYFRVYGNGCFVEGENLKLCVNGSTMTATYNHPSGKVSTINAPVQEKYWNGFSISLNPNFFSLLVRQHGKGISNFVYDDYTYLPPDGDQTGVSINTPVTLKALSVDGHEFINFNVQPSVARKPFCSEEIALCGYDFVSTHAYSEYNRVFFGAHVSKASGAKYGMSDYYRNGGYEAIENTGDMFLSDASDHSRGGAYRTWYGDPNKVELGFTMKKTENSIEEEYGFDISKSTLTPSLIGLYRVPSDAPANYYYGYESNRLPAFKTLTVPDKNFWTDTAVAVNLTTPPGGKITDDGYYVNDSSLCPSGQVELNAGYEGKCFNFIENAGCWAGGNQQQCNGSRCGVTFPSDQNALQCYLRQSFNPTVCPSGYNLFGYSSGTTISATYDQLCRKDVAPVCQSSHQRIGGACYNQATPSCPSSYPARSGGTCTGTASGVCSGGTWNGSACVTRYVAQQCPNGGTYASTSAGTGCWVVTAGPVAEVNGSCPSGYGISYGGSCYNGYTTSPTYTCNKGGSLDGVVCTINYPVSCPSGYPSNISGTLTCTGSTSACTSPYSYNSSFDMCFAFAQNACNSPHVYYSPEDICRSEIVAQCTSPAIKMYDNASGGNAKCYVPDTSVGAPSSHIYCRNGLTYWDYGNREGCYQYKGVACNGTYNQDKIIIGSGNNYGEWTAQCWTKDHDLCPSNQYILRGEHTTNYHCMKQAGDYFSIQLENAASFAKSMWDYLNGGVDQQDLLTGEQLSEVQKNVSMTYFALANRLPEKAGLDYWASDLQGNNYDWPATLESVLIQPEVRSTFPSSLTPAQIVDTVYSRITGSTLEEPLRSQYIKAFTPGQSITTSQGSGCWVSTSLAAPTNNGQCYGSYPIKFPANGPVEAENCYSGYLDPTCQGTFFNRGQTIQAVGEVAGKRGRAGNIQLLANKWDVTTFVYQNNISGDPLGPLITAHNMLSTGSSVQATKDYLQQQASLQAGQTGIQTRSNENPVVIATSKDNYVYGGKMDITQAICPLTGEATCGAVSPEVLMCGTNKSCIGCTDDAPLAQSNPIYSGFSTVKQIGSLFFNVSRDKHDKQSTNDILLQTGGRAASNVELMAIGSIDGWTAEELANTSLPADTHKYIVGVYNDVSKVGFFNECIIDDNMDSLCVADMVACNGDECPYGSQFQCQPINGQKFCSRYSKNCKNMSNPAFGASFDQSTEGANDHKNDGEIGGDGQCLNQIYIFNGNDMRCRPAGIKTGGSNCCQKGTGWFGLTQCKESEKALGAIKSFGDLDGQCHHVGDYCDTKVLGVCLQKKKTYCCFSSSLARIIQDSGRSQLAIGWGTPESPECRGFTPDEFQKIDFSQVDFSEWINHEVVPNIQNNVTNDLSNTINNIGSNITGVNGSR